jgi:hypothetical protein
MNGPVVVLCLGLVLVVVGLLLRTYYKTKSYKAEMDVRIDKYTGTDTEIGCFFNTLPRDPGANSHE